jgi:HEAT repeat protein
MVMNNPNGYTDLLIRISAPRSDGKHHAVEAMINGDSFFFGGHLKLNEEKLRAAILNNRAYGRVLWEALFSEPIERAYQKARGLADTATQGHLRLRLQIDPDASALHAVRWERLLLPTAGREIPLSVSGRTPFSRFISRESAITEPLTRRPIRMVVAISSPSNLPSGLAPIDIEKELDSLRHSLQGLQSPGKLKLTILPGTSGLSDALCKQLKQDGVVIQDGATTLKAVQNQLLNCDLFHFLGHGVFRPGQPSGTSALLLERPDGRVELAKDDDIISRIGDGSKVPRLVFLAACESAKRSEDSLEAFVGLGPKLTQAGVPAVVGMQDLVPMQLAQRLTSKFYQDLLEHGVIDQALNDARLTLFENKHADWSIPVLFMRIRNGCLFTADPLRTLLRKIVENSDQFFAGKEPPLPLDVIRVSGDQEREALLRLETNTTPGDDFKLAVGEIFDNNKTTEPCLAVLLGGPGTAKSAQLKHLAGYLARQTLNTPGTPAVVPVFTHLTNYFKLDIGFQDSFHSFLLHSLRQISPELDDKLFSDWLHDPKGPTFLFLIDGSDRLDDSKRTTVLEQLDEFAKSHPRHSYLLVCDISHFSGLQLRVSDYLVVKPMSRGRLKTYLKSLPDKPGRGLYNKLEKARLFDLVSVPWILVKILAQVRRGMVPHSRTGVLENLVQEMLARLPNENGLRTRAARTLRALAWEIQRSRRTVLSVAEAFRIMDLERGNREYQLEDLRTTLIEHRILAPVGDDNIRFTYPGLQAWFTAQALCAMPDQAEVLDDITATLGRLSRARWWESTLVLLAGSTDNVDSLLRLILYGGRITEGERVFLAARCIQEAGPEKIAEVLRNQVTNALIWLSCSSNEPRTARRQRAITTLGQLQVTTALPHLIKRVLERVRTDWQGQPAFEYSSVRLAAVEALRNMASPTIEYVMTHYPQFTQLLESWFRQDIAALEEQLTVAPPAHQAIAAFVLGNIGSRPAAEVLLKAFQQPGIESATRWAITDALLRVEPALVTRGAILPFIDTDAATAAKLPKESWKKRQHWYERVVYLIGNINPRDSRAGAFLERCLSKYTGVWLKARTIRAIGAIADTHRKNLLQELAGGDFSRIAIGKLDSDEVSYLRSVAIDALAGIGDQQTLSLLQQQDDGSNPELQAAYYRTSEEIAWRLFERDRSFTPSSKKHL